MHMKKIADIVSGLFVAGGLILIFGKRAWFPDFYNPVFMGSMSFVAALLLVSPGYFLKPKDQDQEKVVDMIYVGLIFSLVLGALGALGLYQLYKIGIEYDKILHFLLSVFFTVILTRSYQGWRKYGLKKSLSIAVTIVFLGGLVWEAYEFLGDALLDTEMMGYSGQFVTKDTVWDVIMNSLGVILGIFGLRIFKK